ncbi:MAG TPA: PAS domain S-box protein [Bryobacteraceae bacterium]|nr:PAS domain S-box protein [Bryobacteraceae bacterium]
MEPTVTPDPGDNAPGHSADFKALFELAACLQVAVLPDSPTFTILAVSDAYLRASEKKRADLVGRGLFEVFADDSPTHAAALSNVRASFERVLATREPDVMPVQRFGIQKPGGTLEDRYWNPVNAPVLGDDGKVRFIVHRVDDVTDFVKPRQITTVDGELGQSIGQAHFRLAFNEAPIGMALADAEGRIIELNEAYIKMLGFSREEMIALGPLGLTHPEDVRVTREFIRDLAVGSRPSGAIEKRYLRKNGEVFWARVSVAVHRNTDGSPPQMIAAIEDITEQKRAQERLRAIYDGTYEYICLLAPDGTLLEANRASLEFAGNTREEIVGRPFWDTPWFAHTPGAAEAMRRGVLRAAAGEFVRYEATLIRPSGAGETFDISLHPVRNDVGEVVLIVPEGRNITERKALEQRNEFLVRLDDVTRPMSDAFEITQAAARLLGEQLRVNRCAYADVEPDEDTFNLTGDFNFGVPSIVGRYTFTQFGEECLRLMREGKPYIVEDSETDPRVDAIRESYRATLIRSVICVPLLKAGRFVAAMAVHQTSPRQWRHDEVELVQLVANRCWESIERVHVTRELREREQRFRFLAESIPQMVWTATPDGSVDYVNGQGIAYFNVSEQTVSRAHWTDFIHPMDRERAIRRWNACLATGELYENAFRLLRGADNSWRWHLIRALPLVGEDGAVLQWFGTSTDIEDQKRAEADLQQQWETFDTVLSHTPDFAYTFDLSGRFTYINKALLSLWNKSFEESVGKNFFELGYPTEHAARLQEQIQRVIDTGQPVRDQTPYTGLEGDTRHYEYILVPVLDADGQVESVAGSTRDVTEQNLAARQIESDRRRWRELLLQTPAAVAILRGPEHRFEWVNTHFLQMVGRSADALLGKTVAVAMPEVEGQAYASLLDGVYHTGEPVHGYESLIRIDRGDDGLKDVYVNFVYAPTRDVDGSIDGIFVHAIEVTAMVEARKQLEESERQFRTLAETIPHLAWMADETGYIYWYNRRWYDYTGTVLADMEGWGWQSVHDAFVLPEVIERWGTAIASGEPFEMVFPLKGADGTFRSFLTRSEPMKDSQGKVMRWFGTNTDITSQLRTEEELRRMNRELEEFAYVASHDLQEPLRMVNIYTHLILRTVGDKEGELGQYAAFVRQGVSRMEALIHDLLTFSRTVHNEDPAVGDADLGLSLQEALAVLKNRIEESGATVSASRLPMVKGDTAQLAHVFQNVLANALKYRKPDVAPEIHIWAEQDDGYWFVSVRDNGIGFEMRYAERIFGLFKRLHKDEYPGTGLGLAICKRIVERYGGRMWAESVPGRGSTFHFALPMVNSGR